MGEEKGDKREKKMLSSIQKVWISGTTLVVAIPKRIREVLDIKKGDYVEVDFGEIVKKSEEQVKKLKKKPRKEEDEDIEEYEEDEGDEELPEMD